MKKWIKDEKQALGFSNDFLGRFLGNGFQSLSKKDLDLLIFHLILKHRIIDQGATIYQMAKDLKITPGKVKSLLLESTLRWGNSDPESTVKKVLGQFFQEKNLKRVIANEGDLLKKGVLPILIENPIERMEFENQIKIKRGYPRIERNREIIHLKLNTFIELVSDFMPSASEVCNKLESQLPFDLKSFLKKDLAKIETYEYRKLMNEIGTFLFSKIGEKGISAALSIFGKTVMGLL